MFLFFSNHLKSIQDKPTHIFMTYQLQEISNSLQISDSKEVMTIDW